MIRAYDKNDTDQILHVWREASKLAHPFLAAAFIEQEAENIRKIYLPNTETFVFEEAGEVVGFISMIEREVGAIFLHPAAMKRGIGSHLIDHVKASRPYLTVKVFEKNKMGRVFYEKTGFAEMSRFIHEDTGEMLLEMKLTY